ncbi:PAS domain S-box protein [Caldichromatium japonicum]|uniref:histidine kinase n=1 Tax=Caldichromatium japonicum TaxID=2699430 RepID=A0A6G7VAR5_9GAMM|nr:PAS domain S-box protein [Caldichromatium japonicum]QIK36877.1 PAS domain S-box protein [Caldichromatium japonicum]
MPSQSSTDNGIGNTLPPDPCITGPVALLAWRPESHWPIVYASPNATHLFGYPPEQILNQAFMSLIHPDDLERITSEVVHHLNAGPESWSQRYRIIRADAQVRWLYDLRVVQRDELGTPRLLYGYMLDETEYRGYEEAFRLFAETSAEAIWLSADQGFIYANPAALRLTGHELSALKGLSWRYLSAPREHHRLPTYFAQIEAGRSVHTVLWLHRANQCEVLVELGFHRLADGCLLAIGQAAQSALRNQAPLDPLLHGLIRAIPDLVWLKDPDGIYLACNARFESFFGASESEIIGHTDADFAAPELAELFRHYDREAMRTGCPVLNEERAIFASDGHEELLQTTKIPLRTPEGDPLGVLGIARDLSSSRKLQEELSEVQAIYQAILDQATDSIVLIHAETLRFVAFNKVACQTLGYTRDEFARLGIPDIQADLTPRRLAYWRDRINCVGWGDLETVHRHKNGELHPVAVTNRRVETRQGPCWVAIWRDLSEHKRVEAKLSTYRERLETLVTTRTAELESARLRAECDRLVDRQLLAAFCQAVCQIYGMAAEHPDVGLRPGVRPETGGEDGHIAQPGASGGSAWLAEIGRMLIDRLRPAMDAQQAAPEVTCTPRDCLMRVIQLLEGEAAAKGIRLISLVDPDLPKDFWCNLPTLEQILFALTAQAIALSAAGRIRLHARCSETGGQGLGIRFELQGDAIPKDAWPRQLPLEPLAALTLGQETFRLVSIGALAERLGGTLGIDPDLSAVWLDLPLVSYGSAQTTSSGPQA